MGTDSTSQANDPSTALEVLAELAHHHPELRVAIAKNPSTYPDLLTWLGSLGDSRIDAALRARDGAHTDADLAADSSTTPEVLAELAYQNPELRATIAANPNAYDGLREWIALAGTAPAPVGISTATVLATPALRRLGPSRLARLNAKFGPTFTLDSLVLLSIIVAVSILGLFAGGFAFNMANTLVRTTAASVLPHSNTDSPLIGDNDAPQSPYWDSAQSTRVDGMPSSLPGCPRGSTVAGWSEWSGGGILLCKISSSESWRVLLVSGESVDEGEVTLETASGIQAQFGSRHVEISLGGWLVVDNGTVQPVDSGWTQSVGSQTYASIPSNLATCPANTVTSSLSTWAGGWLLTCGITGDDVVSFSYNTGSESGSGGAMIASGNGQCGTNSHGVPVCVSAAPAIVTIGSSGTRQTYAVHDNYFDASGFGGTGKGAGAYGVDSPEETAVSQVNYLVEILGKSAQARSGVSGVLGPLNSCQVYSADIKALRSLTQSRTDLLAALEFTPVDQIPDGEKVLASLRRALQLSEDADKGYVEASIIMNKGDCGSGRTTYRSALAIADKAEAAKVAFTKLWNSTIAKQYGVKSFSSNAI